MDRLIHKELIENVGIGSFKTPLIMERPVRIGDEIITKAERQGKLIQEFLFVVSRIARKALQENNTQLIQLLFSESCCGCDIAFHKDLPDCCWSVPLFYRTDQSISGKIYEIQSPGSGWGDLYLFAKCYKEKGFDINEIYHQFPRKYSEVIAKATGKVQPKAFHMLDAASVPHSIRYLMAITSEYVDYWGLDSSVTMDSVDFVTAHSVYSLVSNNYFKSYLKRCKTNDITFGLSPNIIFDEKAIYVLPFHRLTRNMFSDEVRALFPFTTIIENGGFFDANGKFQNINNLRKQEKTYYLKYGGPDIDRNWGSRSVFRIKGRNCSGLLDIACNLSKKGEIWLLQEDVSKDYPKIMSSDLNKLISNKNHVKISAYYGTGIFLGAKIMARHHFKVHGQPDTYVSIGIK